MIDRIEREIDLPASPERVWEAITRPEQLSGWFSREAEMVFQVGGEVRLVWHSGEVTRGIIQSIEPPHHFSFRWDLKNTRPGDPLGDSNSTLVTFLLEAIPEGTRLRVVESGFASLPGDVRDAVLAENSHGWDAELDDLARYFAEMGRL